jgi:hypothetical protein
MSVSIYDFRWEKKSANETIKEYKSRLVIDLKHCLTTKFYYLPFPARILILSHFSTAFFFCFVSFNLHAIAKKTIRIFFYVLQQLLLLTLNIPQIVHQLTFKVLRVINHTKCSSRRYTFPSSLLAFFTIFCVAFAFASCIVVLETSSFRTYIVLRQTRQQ